MSQIETPKKLQLFLEVNKVPPNSHIVINSNGGNLYASMQLGRLIRAHRLRIDIGTRKDMSLPRSLPPPGKCLNSCAIAYLGGVYRYLRPKSRFGLSHFSDGGTLNGNAVGPQDSASFVFSYIEEMGVDTEFFKLIKFSYTPDISEPEYSALVDLNIVNNGQTRTEWTVQTMQGAFYLKGERSTAVSGLNKFLVYCESGNVILHTIFDPAGRERELLSFSSHSLMIDSDPYALTPRQKVMQNGLFNSLYTLSSKETSALITARRVGVAIRASSQADIFFGFDDMPFSDAHDKFYGIIKICRE